MKTKMLALLMISVIAAAVAVPMAMGDPDQATSQATVLNPPPTVTVTCPGAIDLSSCSCDCTITYTTISFSGTVGDPNGVETVTLIGSTTAPNGVVQNFVVTPSTGPAAAYTADLVLDCCTGPGTYTLTVTANDNVNPPVTATCTYTVNPNKAIDIDYNKVDFGAGNPLAILNVLGDLIWDTPDNPAPIPNPASVANKGNVPIDVQVSATNLVGGVTAAIIPNGQMTADVCDVGSQTLSAPRTFVVGIPCNQRCDMDYTLTLPNVPGDTYTGTIFVTAV